MSQELFVPITPPALSQMPSRLEPVSTDASETHRKQSFAIVSALKGRLYGKGLTPDDVWAFFTSHYGVDSRKELTAKEWALLTARLSAAQRDAKLFHILVELVRQYKRGQDCEDAIEIRQRKNKAIVDVVYSFDDTSSECSVNLEKETVRGREFELRRIVKHIKGSDVCHMNVEMLKRAVWMYVITKDIDKQTTPSTDAVRSYLKADGGWVKLETICAHFTTENQDALLALLRELYRDRCLEYQEASGNWFRCVNGGAV